jgi:predicted hydrolase (HD superfamily)
MPTREEALEFLTQYVSNEYQLHHAEMVAIAMEAVAKHLGESDTEKFYITGLIHDWDFDQWPEEHPGRYDQLKGELGIDDEVVDAIKGHADLDFPRETILAKALLACDEFSGLLYAYMKMVGNYKDMKTSSIRKKVYKEVNFAAKINREDVKTGISELGIPEEDFFALVRDTFSAKYDLAAV